MTEKEYATFRKLAFARYALTKPERLRLRKLAKKELPPEQSQSNQGPNP